LPLDWNKPRIFARFTCAREIDAFGPTRPAGTIGRRHDLHDDQRTNAKESRHAYLEPWLDAVKFGFEVQNVMALRLLKIAAEGAGSSIERTRMATENVNAVADAQAAEAVAPAESIAQTAEAVALAQGESIAQAADAVALAQGESINTATKPAMAPIKRRVHANRRRLKGK
jgi:hypothetical protein